MRPLRRSRARFPLLSPTVTSSPGAGEVFPQRESQAVRLVAKVLGAMRKCPAALLPLPLGEVDLRSKDGEGARREEPLPSCRCASSHPLPTLSLARHLSPAGESLSKGTAFCSGDKLSGSAKGVPLGGAGKAAGFSYAKNTPAGINPRGCYYAVMFPAPLGVQSRKHQSVKTDYRASTPEKSAIAAFSAAFFTVPKPRL